MRILHVVRQYPPFIGGLESSVSCVAQEMAHRSHQITVVTLNKRMHGNTKLPLGRKWESGVLVERVRSWSGRYAVPRWRPPRTGYDVIHFHGIDGFLEQWFRQTGHRLPAVLTTHGLIFHTSRLRWIKHYYWHTQFARCAANLHIIASSQQDALRLGQIGLSASVIPNPIRVPDKIVHGSVTPPWDFVVIGRIAEHKGIGALIRTFDHLHRRLPGLRLLLAGEDWDGSIRRLGPLPVGVTWSGPVNEIEKFRLWTSARLVLFPSEREGFGMALVEAMGVGAVVVAQPNGAHQELVQDGVNGFLIDFHRPFEAAGRLAQLLTNDRLRDVRTAARLTAHNYKPERLVDHILSIYENALRTVPKSLDIQNQRR